MSRAERMRSWWLRSPTAPTPDLAAHAQDLRALYLEHLDEEPRSLDQRVAYHLHHLMLYWSRVIGFLDLVPEPLPSGEMTHGTALVMVRVASELADADVRAYASDTARAELAQAWDEYQRAVAPIPRDGIVSVARVRWAGNCFDQVDEARRALGLLHGHELERPPGAAGSV